jgi:hypothetical protein
MILNDYGRNRCQFNATEHDISQENITPYNLWIFIKLLIQKELVSFKQLARMLHG